MSDRPAPPLTVARVLVAATVLATVVGLTLAPRCIAWPARTLLLDALALLPPRWTDVLLVGGADTSLNVVFFVPLGMALALLLPLRWAPASVLLSAGVSAAVETAQSVIPGRVPDVGDVGANTVGALAGTVVIVVLRLLTRR